MRIALVVTGGVDPSGTRFVIPALLALIERLARVHEVHVYALQKDATPSTYPLLGATVHDLGRPRGIWRQTAALIQRLRADGPFAVLHAYWALPGGVTAALAGRRLGVPVIVTCDSGEFARLPDIGYGLQRRWRQRLAVRLAVALASQVTVCSAFQQRLAARHGVTAQLLPLGVPLDRFPPPATRLAGPPWRIIHVANLNPVKDQTTLLAAFARVVQCESRVHLDVVGLDTLDGALLHQAQHLGVADHVTFHGALTTAALVPLYQQASLAVLTSRHEAAGVVTREAAACGVPTVGTAVGVVDDWAPTAAVAVPVGDAEALASALLALLAQPDVREALATAARERTAATDAEWTAHHYLTLYAAIAHRQSSTSTPGS